MARRNFPGTVPNGARQGLAEVPGLSSQKGRMEFPALSLTAGNFRCYVDAARFQFLTNFRLLSGATCRGLIVLMIPLRTRSETSDLPETTGRKMKTLQVIPESCTGCMRCELACSQEQTGTFQPSRSVIRVSALEGHTSYAPFTCTQCAEGWCMTACPVDAIILNAAGAKAVESDQCVGCKLCTIACPYGTIFYDTAEKKAIKCDLCGGDPACAKACPTQAIVVAEVESGDWLGDFAASRAGYNLTGRVDAK